MLLCTFSGFPYINDVEIVVCLDSIGQDSPLKVHVSKPPKENSAGAKILQVSCFHLNTLT